jgi:gamma-glutamyltranspeptidase/glutathione hydrolase
VTGAHGRLAVAAPNSLAAAAGEAVAAVGGNAVDAAVAAMVVACTTEPGICSLAGGGYATVTAPGSTAVTIDGNVAMPGLGRDGPFDDGFELHTGYGGGVDMLAGHGSVATHGTPQMLVRLHELHGAVPWAEVLEPAVRHAAEGFPIGSASDHYLDFVHETLYGWHEPSHAAVHHADGRRLTTGDTCRIEHLDETLRTWQRDPDTFAAGEVAERIVADVLANGGALGHDDLAAYEPVVRDPLTIELDGWRFATNPPPAVGGVVLALMLQGLGHPPPADGWRPADRDRLVRVMRAVLGHRVDVLDLAEDRDEAGWRAVDAVLADGLAGLTSPSTCHVSAADADGHAVAITCSSGYGSGAMPPGTGVWLNNCLGEKELVRRGRDGYAPGERLPSNMAPTVGADDRGRLIAIGSPGADRITSALTQTLAGIAGGMSLAGAVEAPRVHVTRHPDGTERLDVEEDVHLAGSVAPGVERRMYPSLSMYFGGVAACAVEEDRTLLAAADPRRDGATTIA